MANAVSIPRTGYQTRISDLYPSSQWRVGIPELGQLKPSNGKCEASLGYMVKLYFKANIKITEDKQTNNKKPKHSIFKEKVHHPRLNGDSECVPNPHPS